MFERGMVQIAGILDLKEAKMLEHIGINWLGFPLVLDVYAEDCTVQEAQQIIPKLYPETKPVLITYETDPKRLIDLTWSLGIEIVQLHAPVEIEVVMEMKKTYSELTIIKSLIITGDEISVLKEAELFEPYVDAFLTDTYDASTGASGATGKKHDWSISRKLVQTSSKPVILAGGLNPENVYEAIQEVGPIGVDCHTGVEDETGRKDPELIWEFTKEVYRGYHG